jgi:hypothetical protein
MVAPEVLATQVLVNAPPMPLTLGTVVFEFNVTVPVAEQPLLAVTVTLYVPAEVSETLLVVAPPVHKYVAAVGTDKLMLGLVHVMVVVLGVSLMVADGGVAFEVSVTLLVAVQPLRAVTVT